MKKTFLVILLASSCLVACGQTKTKKIVGGGCEGCELYTEGMPANLSWQTTIAQKEVGDKLQISGTIYKKDGKTPVAEVIMYFYHTDSDGLYKATPKQKIAKRHGRLRGWIKTDDRGRYLFNTIRPATYPKTEFLAHIHPTIKEPYINEYYIDDFVFEDDPHMNDKNKASMQNRGGNGIVKLVKNTEGVWVGKRDIILGLNIPNY